MTRTMTIYIDNGEAVKIYSVEEMVGRAVATLLEAEINDEIICSETHIGYGVAIVDKEREALEQYEELCDRLDTVEEENERLREENERLIEDMDDLRDRTYDYLMLEEQIYAVSN